MAPPGLDPARWEDFEGFRETFLLHFTEPGHNAALRSLGELLYSLVLEAPYALPDPAEGWVRVHTRAALADLRFLEGFLLFLGEERRDAGATPEEERLSRSAGRTARSLCRIADRLARVLESP